MPSPLSVRATLFLGRHETHIRKRSRSCRTQMSKIVPYSPPKTGLPEYLRQPPWTSESTRFFASESDDSMPAIAARISNSLLFISRQLSFQLEGMNPG